jgi:hypothetical protein
MKRESYHFLLDPCTKNEEEPFNVAFDSFCSVLAAGAVVDPKRAGIWYLGQRICVHPGRGGRSESYICPPQFHLPWCVPCSTKGWFGSLVGTTPFRT